MKLADALLVEMLDLVVHWCTGTGPPEMSSSGKFQLLGLITSMGRAPKRMASYNMKAAVKVPLHISTNVL